MYPFNWRSAAAISLCSNLAMDSKLRGCDMLRLRFDDVYVDGRVRYRTTVVQKKTGRPVQVEITEQTRTALGEWLAAVGGGKVRYLFPGRFRQPPHLSTAQHARIVHQWVECAGLNGSAYGALTHCAGTKRHRFTRRPATCEPVQLPFGHTKLESAVRYLGIGWTMPSPSRNRSSYRRAR